MPITNMERARIGLVLVQTQQLIIGVDRAVPEESDVTDMVTNLFHLCDRLGISIERTLTNARMHYEAETNPNDDMTPGEALKALINVSHMPPAEFRRRFVGA